MHDQILKEYVIFLNFPEDILIMLVMYHYYKLGFIIDIDAKLVLTKQVIDKL
jgi:hypothetical protein